MHRVDTFHLIVSSPLLSSCRVVLSKPIYDEKTTQKWKRVLQKRKIPHPHNGTELTFQKKCYSHRLHGCVLRFCPENKSIYKKLLNSCVFCARVYVFFPFFYLFFASVAIRQSFNREKSKFMRRIFLCFCFESFRMVCMIVCQMPLSLLFQEVCVCVGGSIWFSLVNVMK